MRGPQHHRGHGQRLLQVGRGHRAEASGGLDGVDLLGVQASNAWCRPARSSTLAAGCPARCGDDAPVVLSRRGDLQRVEQRRDDAREVRDEVVDSAHSPRHLARSGRRDRRRSSTMRRARAGRGRVARAGPRPPRRAGRAGGAGVARAARRGGPAPWAGRPCRGRSGRAAAPGRPEGHASADDAVPAVLGFLRGGSREQHAGAGVGQHLVASLPAELVPDTGQGDHVETPRMERHGRTSGGCAMGVRSSGAVVFPQVTDAPRRSPTHRGCPRGDVRWSWKYYASAPGRGGGLRGVGRAVVGHRPYRVRRGASCWATRFREGRTA